MSMYRDNKSLKEISNHKDLKDKNGVKIRKDKLKYWIERIKQTGDVKIKSRKGV